MKNFIILNSILIFFLGQYAFSAPVCPQVKYLQDIHILKSDLYEKKPGYWWYDPNGFRHWEKGEWGMHEIKSYFGTNTEWNFILGNVIADNVNEAWEEYKKHYNEISVNLTFWYGPPSWMGHWDCYYKYRPHSEDHIIVST